MSPALIIALILFPLLHAIRHSWRQLKRERANLQYKYDPDSISLLDVGERRQASAINGPGARHRLNDQVTRLLAMLAATSFAIAIASRYLTSW